MTSSIGLPTAATVPQQIRKGYIDLTTAVRKEEESLHVLLNGYSARSLGAQALKPRLMISSEKLAKDE
jgi:hypothetical protein